jgi:AraC-like DNA-binding protein
MKNRFFDARMLDLLLTPERWSLVTSFTAPDKAPCDDRQHATWRRTHTHHHQHTEILFGLRGESVYGFMGKAYRCSPGTLIFFDSSEEHDQGYPKGIASIHHLWISLLQDRIFSCVRFVKRNRLEMAPGSNCIIAMEDTGLQANTLLAECRKAADRRPAAATRLRLLAVFAAVLGRVVEEGYRDSIAENLDAFQAQTIDAIRQHILATGGSDASLDNLARISGYSKFHFVRLFKRYTGQPVGRYINWCRTQKMDELRKSGKSLKEIGVALGFSCQSAFCRWRRQQATAT